MLYAMLVIAGLVPLSMKGLAVAATWQLASAAGLDWTLDRRAHKGHLAAGGWPQRSDFPVVGEPGWQDKVHDMTTTNRRNR